MDHDKDITEAASASLVVVDLTKDTVVARIKDFLSYIKERNGWPSGMTPHKANAEKLAQVVLEGLEKDYLSPGQAHELVLTSSLSLAVHLKNMRGRGHFKGQGQGQPRTA